MQLMFTVHVQVFSHGSCIQAGKLPGPQYWLPKSLSEAVIVPFYIWNIAIWALFGSRNGLLTASFVIPLKLELIQPWYVSHLSCMQCSPVACSAPISAIFLHLCQTQRQEDTSVIHSKLYAQHEYQHVNTQLKLNEKDSSLINKEVYSQMTHISI